MVDEKVVQLGFEKAVWMDDEMVAELVDGTVDERVGEMVEFLAY